MPYPFTIFDNRFDEAYYDHLIGLLGNIPALSRGATGGEKQGTSPGKVYKKGIQLDFCGFAATTLLGINIENDQLKPKRLLVKELFAALLSEATVSKLNRSGVYLQVRFVFPYLYSTFTGNMIRTETSSLPPVNGGNRKSYSFLTDQEITYDLIHASSFRKNQAASLEAIAGIVESNKDLVLTHHDKSDNTLEVRFTLLPLPLCVMILNRLAISDPYMYSREIRDNNIKNLFCNYPVLQFNEAIEKEKDYFGYLVNHFEYIFYNELTLLCRDATNFDVEDECDGLARIKPPDELKWEWKIKRIKRYLARSGHTATHAEEKAWLEYVQKESMKYIIVPSGVNSMAQLKPGERSKGELSMWMEEGMYCFRLKIHGTEDLFEYKKYKADLVFKVLLHYAYAKLHNHTPVMHERQMNGMRIFKDISNTLPNYNVHSPGIKLPNNYLFSHIFMQNKDYSLKFDAPSIRLKPDDTALWKDTVTYQRTRTVFVPIFDYKETAKTS